MAQKRKPLEDWQREDAARLKALWEAYQARTGLKQEDVLHHFSFSQGAFSQYINGTIKLNIEAMLDFAHVLDCRLCEISPTLSAPLYRWVSDAEQRSLILVEECLNVADIKLLSVTELRAVEAMIKQLISGKKENPTPGNRHFRPRLVTR